MQARHLAVACCLVGIAGFANAEYPDASRDLAASCAGCHGTNGRSTDGFASLAGVPTKDTLQKLDAFRTGKRPATVMHQIVKGYTPEQLKLIAEYFAAQK